jgi:hypothetical protein
MATAKTRQCQLDHPKMRRLQNTLLRMKMRLMKSRPMTMWLNLRKNRYPKKNLRSNCQLVRRGMGRKNLMRDQALQLQKPSDL